MKYSDLETDRKPLVHLNPNSWKFAQDFAYTKWCERAEENGYPRPMDLSSSCKFTSLFVQKVFGGKIEGNEFHYFNRIRGKIHDLNEFAYDVHSLDNPYAHTPREIRKQDYLSSLESCVPRVNSWTSQFLDLAKQHNWLIIRAKAPENSMSMSM